MMHIQLEKRVRYLQHEDVWVVVLMTDEDPLSGPSHAMLLIMLF